MVSQWDKVDYRTAAGSGQQQVTRRMAEMLDKLDERLDHAGLAVPLPVRITQGSWSDAPESVGTHSGSGAVDLGTSYNPAGNNALGIKVAKMGRDCGLLMFPRYTPTFSIRHLHAYDPVDPYLADGAKQLVKDWENGGPHGSHGNALAGSSPDPLDGYPVSHFAVAAADLEDPLAGITLDQIGDIVETRVERCLHSNRDPHGITAQAGINQGMQISRDAALVWAHARVIGIDKDQDLLLELIRKLARSTAKVVTNQKKTLDALARGVTLSDAAIAEIAAATDEAIDALNELGDVQPPDKPEEPRTGRVVIPAPFA